MVMTHELLSSDKWKRLLLLSRSHELIFFQRPVVPDSQVLVDKIVKLQRVMAKKQEKVDFMEEHISTLLEEVKKKNRIIQHYVMKAESGALVTTESDRNKVI